MIEWGRSVDRVRKTGFPNGDLGPAWDHFRELGVRRPGGLYQTS